MSALITSSDENCNDSDFDHLIMLICIYDSTSFIQKKVFIENKQKFNLELLITNFSQSSSTSLKLQNIFSK